MRPNLVVVPELGLHDLPPRWDGLAVHWREWKQVDDMFSCSMEDPFLRPSRSPQHGCEACGVLGPTLIAQGLLGDDPDMTSQDVAADDAACQLAHRNRLPRERRSWIKLTAMRCVACGDDTVVDSDGGVWTLDVSDYGDKGSSTPSVS